ncbi:uncharacterized protein M421DRAFT_101539 [Didymella exigua CBS 183.55]|uniref:F-box domain-containing protein n=1 Tax=Didymella exigua CBS 183.55 TaxID=1150837 RepID=A0A6A5RPZ1_9PLEO|nr:uncharacterized protein M421DRAFT_101539 [Didymella exigua CBS 183.55]KAF1927557.1 hypothetical protein M421DRAFT_101539 [Didymella exigua CBS 183.55]
MTFFENFSYDVIFELNKYLSLDDVVHLSQTCRQLRASIFSNDQVARQVVGAHHLYTEEASEAQQKIFTYRHALCSIYERRQAFSVARPFAAQVVGQGHSFLYRCGVLCAKRDSTISVTSVRSAGPSFEFNLGQLLLDHEEYHLGNSFEMMYYSEDLLAVLVAINEQESNGGDPQENFIVLTRTTPGLSDRERIIRVVSIGPAADSCRLFVRHTSKYMYFGLHNTLGRDGHRKWVIKGCSLDPDEPDNDIWMNPPLLIEDFHGNDVGSTVAFEIHDGYFYAVSNQGTYEVEEVDWTSFYHCVRFPLDNNAKEAVQRDTRVYRRQHAEGAIHDSWTDLTLQHDEETNELYIVESRREWLGATSKQARTFYTSKIQFPTFVFGDFMPDVGSSSSSTSQPRPLPDNDILTTLLGSSHNANYMPTPEQYSWTRHPEFPTSNRSPFTLAKTKFRAYNYSCSTFLDLVEDENCCTDRSPNSRPCLRLRMGSRRVAPSDTLIIQSGKGKYPVKHNGPIDLSPAEYSPYIDHTHYRYPEINMWPPPPSTCQCAVRLHRIINPVFRSSSTWGGGGIQAVSDERSIVYMVKPSGENVDSALGTIVLVDFGRSNVNLQAGNDLRWERGAGQEARCRDGTCA